MPNPSFAVSETLKAEPAVCGLVALAESEAAAAAC